MQQVIKGIGISLEDKLNHSISLLKENEPEEGYYGGFSGGKDSTVIKEVCNIAKVKVTWHYHVTTIDPPELIRFIKDFHGDVIFDRKERKGMFQKILEKGMPTRRARWCCDAYKERKIKGVQVLGIRGDESPRRAKNWSEVSVHNNTKSKSVLPIFTWSDDEVWYFIKSRGIPYCSLYDEGFKRLGCIGCPMASLKNRTKEFERWPKYKQAWKKASDRNFENRTGTLQVDGREWFGTARFKDKEEFWLWWNGEIEWPKEKEN